MLKPNYIKEKLLAGKPVLGTWCIIPSVVTADIIAKSGLDFLIIDAEHGPINFETAQNMAIACESHAVSPIMRVGNINESEILKALDTGVHGIQIPNVSSPNDIAKIIQYSKYPPVGNRGYSPFTRAGGYSAQKSSVLPKVANENTLIGINIEGLDAINRIDEILLYDNLDIVFIGLFDLSKALGMPGEVENKAVVNQLRSLTKKINNAGKYAGTIATKEHHIEEFIDIGIKYIVYLVDCEMLSNSYRQIVNEFNGKKS